MQQFFNQRILKEVKIILSLSLYIPSYTYHHRNPSTCSHLLQEQQLYAKEGLNVKQIDYIDNQDCLGQPLYSNYSSIHILTSPLASDTVYINLYWQFTF